MPARRDAQNQWSRSESEREGLFPYLLSLSLHLPRDVDGAGAVAKATQQKEHTNTSSAETHTKRPFKRSLQRSFAEMQEGRISFGEHSDSPSRHSLTETNAKTRPQKNGGQSIEVRHVRFTCFVTKNATYCLRHVFSFKSVSCHLVWTRRLGLWARVRRRLCGT